MPLGCETLRRMSPAEPPSPPRGIRAQRRATIEAEILRVARQHLGTYGAAALSLRAIARDLGMVSSGIYRYVESRDELLTRLIVHAYTSLAGAVEAEHARADQQAHDDLDGRWRAIGRGLRAWALAHPHDFALLYGSPVPDYHAPAERTSGPGTAVQALLIHLAADAGAAGRLARAAYPEGASRATRTMLEDPMFTGLPLTAETLFTGLAAWTLLLGTVTSEVFEQLGADTLADPELYFDVMLETAGRLLLAPADPGLAERLG